VDANFGDILKGLQKKLRRAKKSITKRDQAQRIVDDYFQKPGVHVASVRNGEMLIETASSAQFQEIEGFHRDALLAKFRGTELKVARLRVRLANEKQR
jgi:hypothetical protein